MKHCTPEQLALAALREPLPDEDDRHLAGCAQCRAEVASLRRSVDALAVPELAAPGAGVAPPRAVWSSIAAVTGVSAEPRFERVEQAATASRTRAERAPAGGAAEAGAGTPHAGTHAPGTPHAGTHAPGTPPAGSHAPGNEAAAGVPGDDALTGEPPSGRVVPLMPVRRSLRSRLLLAAASLVLGAALGAGAVALVRDREEQPPAAAPLAATPLSPVGAQGATGEATVVRQGDNRVLEVSLQAPALSEGYYEVWLADANLKGMIAVGILHDGSARLELPEGVDLADYRVIDVSAEPLDGDPGHSAVSVARGQLQQ